MFSFYIPNENYLKVNCMFPNIVYITLFQEPEITVGSAAPVLKIRVSAMLLLLTVGIRSYGIWVYSAAKMFIPRFTQIGSLVQKLKEGNLYKQICSCGEKK
jgi:hypothetical protein